MADIMDATQPGDSALASTIPSYIRTIATLLNLLNDAIIALGTIPVPPVYTRIVTENYQVLVTDLFLFVTAASGETFISLPLVADLTGVYASYSVWVKKTDDSANPVTIISLDGGVTIEGGTSLQLALQNEAVLLNFDGTNFRQL